MSELLHQLVETTAIRHSSRVALSYKGEQLDYGSLWAQIDRMAHAYESIVLQRGERLGVDLEKRLETVIGIFAATAAGAVFVPINPILKPRQVGYIMRDCSLRLLVTSRQRATDLDREIESCPDLKWIVSVDGVDPPSHPAKVTFLEWKAMATVTGIGRPARVIDTDI